MVLRNSICSGYDDTCIVQLTQAYKATRYARASIVQYQVRA